MDLKASVAKEFFLGNIKQENIFPFPELKASEKETISFVIESINRFMEDKGEDFRKFDVQGYQPEEYVNKLKELGLFSLIIPEEFGGLELSNTGYSRVLQETSRFDPSTSLTIGAHSSIGMKGLLLFGNKEQKEKYLPLLASGELIAAFCLTEPGAGSDAASIKTSAVRNPDGTWTLNGEKIWITNGSLAGFYTVFAKTENSISAFIVERQFAGVSVGNKEDKMGIRASATNSVFFKDVIIPEANLLGEYNQGFKIAMSILNNGRTGLGGGCIGGIKQCIKNSVEYAKQRKQFGQPISEYRLIKEKIAQMAVDCYAVESVVAMLGGYIDAGVEDYSTEAAMSKIFASEALWRNANEALQIAGGNGFMREYPYERLVRDSRINMIFEGTSEILRLFIALSGMKETGTQLKEVAKSIKNIFDEPIKSLGLVSDYVTQRVSQLTGFGRENIELHHALRDDADVYEIYTLALARESQNIIRKYQKDIISKQHLLKRLADVSIDLFVGLSVLSRVNSVLETKTEKEAADELAIARIFTRQARRRMNQNLRRLEKNDDDAIDSLADSVIANGYRWDIL